MLPQTDPPLQPVSSIACLSDRATSASTVDLAAAVKHGHSGGSPKTVVQAKHVDRAVDAPPNVTGVTRKQLKDFKATLEEYEARKQQRDTDRATLSALLACSDVPGPEKQRARCEHIIKWGRILFQCPNCWLLPGNCICSRLERFDTQTHVAFWMHHDEWCKGSNTGCVAQVSLPNSQMLMRGYQQHDQQLTQLLEDPTHTVAVLWPGADALTPQQLQQLAQQRSNGRIAIVAVDANWDNACRMQRKLPPGTLQLMLPPDLALTHGAQGSLFAPLRKYCGDSQTTGRVCTLEAVAAALWALEPAGDRQQLYDGLLHNLKIKVDAMRLQKHMGAVYDAL